MAKAQAALCRICEIRRDSLAVLRIQHAFVLNGDSQCLYDARRFPRL